MQQCIERREFAQALRDHSRAGCRADRAFIAHRIDDSTRLQIGASAARRLGRSNYAIKQHNRPDKFDCAESASFLDLSHRPPGAIKTETRMKRPLECFTRRDDVHPATLSVRPAAGSGKARGIVAAGSLIVVLNGVAISQQIRANIRIWFHATGDNQQVSRIKGIPVQLTFVLKNLISGFSRSQFKVP